MKIELKDVNYSYNPGLVNEIKALKDINLTIDGPCFIALTGSTGSGKSTLVQMLNGLLKPDKGNIYFDGLNIYDKLNVENVGKKDKEKIKNEKQALAFIRKKVGIVFQYPESQLFEETVIKDVKFGPKNLGLSEEEINNRAKWALESVGINQTLFEKSPYDLSGGEMRRAAIAGVIAMNPEVLVLDEPTAGLDPEGRETILNCIKKIQQENQLTVVWISHTMEEVACYADRMISMNEGEIVMDGTPHEIFKNNDGLKKCGLKKPKITEFCERLSINNVITVDEAVEIICRKAMS